MEPCHAMFDVKSSCAEVTMPPVGTDAGSYCKDALKLISHEATLNLVVVGRKLMTSDSEVVPYSLMPPLREIDLMKENQVYATKYKKQRGTSWGYMSELEEVSDHPPQSLKSIVGLIRTCDLGGYDDLIPLDLTTAVTEAVRDRSLVILLTCSAALVESVSVNLRQFPRNQTVIVANSRTILNSLALGSSAYHLEPVCGNIMCVNEAPQLLLADKSVYMRTLQVIRQ
eukprot:5471204-Pyramimonas_sp.AAC.1